MTFFQRQWSGSSSRSVLRTKELPVTKTIDSSRPFSKQPQQLSQLGQQVAPVTLESFDSMLMSYHDNDSRERRGTIPNSSYHNTNELRSDVSSRSTTSVTMAEADEEIQEVMNRLDVTQCRKLRLVGADTLSNLEQETNASMPHTQSDGGEFQVLHNPLPVSALSEIIREAPNLICLELYNMELAGTAEKFVDLANAIEYQGTLQALSLEYCRIGRSIDGNKTDNSSIKDQPLDFVVIALCRNLYLRDLTLVADAPQSLGTLSATTLGLLGSSQSLHTLRLCNMGMTDDETSALAQALKQNNALRNLQVSLSMGEVGSNAMVSMLTHNVSVETLDVVLEQVEDDDSTLQLARAMQSSKSLVDFDLSFADDLPLTSTFQQVYDELQEWKEVAKDMSWKSTSLSNCPFMRLINSAIDYSLSDCCTGSQRIYKTL